MTKNNDTSLENRLVKTQIRLYVLNVKLRFLNGGLHGRYMADYIASYMAERWQTDSSLWYMAVRC